MGRTTGSRRSGRRVRSDASGKCKLDWPRLANDKVEKITLSPIDWETFYNSLIDPPEPNEKLKAAARHYRERLGG